MKMLNSKLYIQDYTMIYTYLYICHTIVYTVILKNYPAYVLSNIPTYQLITGYNHYTLLSSCPTHTKTDRIRNRYQNRLRTHLFFFFLSSCSLFTFRHLLRLLLLPHCPVLHERCEFLEASAVLIMRKIVSLYHDFYCNSHIQVS